MGSEETWALTAGHWFLLSQTTDVSYKAQLWLRLRDLDIQFKLSWASKEATSATEFQSNRQSRGQKVEWEAHRDKKSRLEDVQHGW